MVGPVMASLSIGAVRADALFVSRLQRGDEPDPGRVRRAVAEALLAFGCSGCAGWVAQEFGDHPETAGGGPDAVGPVTAEAFTGPVPRPSTDADRGRLLAAARSLPGGRASGPIGAARRGLAGSVPGGQR